MDNITRTGDFLIIPVSMTLEEISNYQHTPKILKKAINMIEDKGRRLRDALNKEPYLMPVFVLADAMMESDKGNWSLKIDYGVDIKGYIRIDLYGLESFYYETKKGNDGKNWILAGVATVQNANVPDFRVVLGDHAGVIFRDKKLEGIIQGNKIQDAKRKKMELLSAYRDAIGDEGNDWLDLLEEFLNISGL